MASIVRPLFGRLRRALLGLLFPTCLGLLSAPGCVTTAPGLGFLNTDPGHERPCGVVSFWDRNVRIALDTEHHGAEIPMLAGRVFFFGPDKRPMAARGKLAIYWYDMTGPADGPHPQLGECLYDADTLDKLKKTDMVGVGYTVVASWQNYRPEVKHIKVQVCFMPERGGSPIYGEPALVSLHSDAPITSRQATTPIAAIPQPGAAAAKQ